MNRYEIALGRQPVPEWPSENRPKPSGQGHTETCIFCRAVAIMWNGHVIRYGTNEKIFAGRCYRHKDMPVGKVFQITGCHGLWRDEYGVRYW
jgi:hypothetical protein